jgi:hypothetical protein
VAKRPDREAQDEQLVLHLARGLSRQAAAKAVGLSKRTVYNRLADPAFRGRVDTRRRELVDDAIGLLAGAARFAVRRLIQLAKSTNEPVALGAARGLLSELVRVETHAKLEAEVAELRRLVEQNQGGKRWA